MDLSMAASNLTLPLGTIEKTAEMHHAALDTGQLISLNQGFT